MEGIENNKYVPLVAARAKEEGARYISHLRQDRGGYRRLLPRGKKAWLNGH